MKKLVLLAVLASQAALADDPDQASLIEAWERYMADLPSTVVFDRTGERRYRIEDSDLNYSGELVLSSALVRPAEAYGQEPEFSYLGILEFRLSDLDAERLGTQAYYYWLSDRQTLHYSSKLGAWVDPAQYRASFINTVPPANALAPLRFMINYGIWVLLIGLIVFLMIVLSKQAKKARAIMNDSADINASARRNIERAAKLQDEMLEITRASQELQKQNNALLERIANALDRKS